MSETEKINTIELKEKAEASIEKAKQVILQNIPAEEVTAIYVKGSYVQGELMPDSDVDVVVILKTEEYLPKVYTLDTDASNPAEIPFSIVAYTLGELQTGEKASNRPKTTSPVSVFVKQIDHLPLIYGAKPEGNLFTRTDKKDLTAHASAFRSTFLPDYAAGKFTFKELVKQVLWLADREQRVLGNARGYSWQVLANNVTDKNHIIHTALTLRRQEKISLEEETDFVKKSGEYLSLLENKYVLNK
jgi:predicted nucleotidyltransferase